MLPFLRVKRAQAELVLEMLGRAWPASENGRGISWTPEISEEWAAAKTRMEDLNARGMAVPGEEIALLVGDQWMIPQSDLFGERWETFSGRFPTSGSLRNGALYARPTLAPPTSGSGGSVSPGLPTPTARDWKGQGHDGQLPNAVSLLPTPRTSDKNGAGVHGTGGQDLRTVISLLPTPDTGLSPNSHGRRGGKAGNGSQSGASLEAMVKGLSTGPSSAPPSPAGNTSSDAPHPVQLTIEDALIPDSSNG